MSNHYHVLDWIDHRQAKVFQFNAVVSERTIIHSTHPNQNLHHKANSNDSGHAGTDHAFFERVAHAVANAGALLITGPASAKTELVAHIKKKHPDLAARISAVETLDHPGDGALLALGRTFFKADDRMHFQSPRT